MDTTFVPTPQDDNLKIEAAITKSASFAGTTFDWGQGFAPGGVGLPAVIVAQLSALTQTAGATITLTPIESSDYDGTNATTGTWTVCGPAITIASGGSVSGFTDTAGILSVPCFPSKRYFRGSLTITAGTLTMSAWLHPLVAANSVL